jgi:hypothetical protein
MARALQFLAALVAVVAISLVAAPAFWVYAAMMTDFFTDRAWKMTDSPLFLAYHKFITDIAPEVEAQPLPEINIKDFTREKFTELTKNFTFPVVIRGGAAETDAVKYWKDFEFWYKDYANEEVLCKSKANKGDKKPEVFCRIADLLRSVEAEAAGGAESKLYVNGASSIFVRRPELINMVESPVTGNLTAVVNQSCAAYQIFMGSHHVGSSLHTAIGTNVFRMIVGRKRWWFIPPSQTKYIFGVQTVNGFSAHSKTVWQSDPWFKKMERYEVTLNPGDILLNTPWFWHAVENKDPFTIGVASRFTDPVAAAANNPVQTFMAHQRIKRNYGTVEAFKKMITTRSESLDENGRDLLESSIAKNRDIGDY